MLAVTPAGCSKKAQFRKSRWRPSHREKLEVYQQITYQETAQSAACVIIDYQILSCGNWANRSTNILDTANLTHNSHHVDVFGAYQEAFR